MTPEPVGHPPDLQRDVALVIQQWRQQPIDRGIMNGDALQIEACRLDPFGRGVESLAGDAREPLAALGASAEPLTDLISERASKIAMIEDRRRQRSAEHGIADEGGFGFAADGLPELVD